MLTFLNPVFLFAAASVLIPIVLHLIQSRRTIKLPFSTIRFLKLAEQSASRRIRMEHFLLWLLRTLLLIAIVLAFAMPMLRTTSLGGFLKRSRRDVALVVDTSYSMRYETGSATVWDAALQCAAAVLDGLNPGDRVCVYAAGRTARPVLGMLTEEIDSARAALDALQPEFAASQLAPAILAANDALQEDTRGREREIHILTDNQLLPWTGFTRSADRDTPDGGAAAAAGAWDPARIDPGTAIFVTRLGVQTPENSSLAAIELSQAQLGVDTPSRVTATLSRTGPPGDTSVALYIDGEERARRAVRLDPAQPASCAFHLAPLPAGVHAARIELPPDSLAVDNTFHFLLEVKDRLPSACVGDADDTFFVRKALAARSPGLAAIDSKALAADELDGEVLSGYACLFLCNTPPLSGQNVLRVERYVRDGGLLVLFPGDRTGVADYAPWSCLPAPPTAVTDVAIDRRKRTLRWADARHPVLREIARDAGISPLVTLRRHMQFGALHEDAGIVIHAGVDTPFLLERTFGNGVVLLANTTADRSWSSFPLSPYYLPLLREMVQYGASLGGFTPYRWTTESLRLSEALPGATHASRLEDPSGAAVALRSVVVDNETVLAAEQLTRPGLYTWLAATGHREPALALNVPRRESDLAPLDAARIPALTGLHDSYIAAGRDELLRHIATHRVGRTLGEPLLWLALFLAAAECALANVLSRQTPKLSDALGLAASGKMKGSRS